MDKKIIGIKVACLSAEITVNTTEKLVKFHVSFWKWNFSMGALVYKD